MFDFRSSCSGGLVPAASHTTWSCWVPGSQVITDHSDEAFSHPDYIGKASDRINQKYVSFIIHVHISPKFKVLTSVSALIWRYFDGRSFNQRKTTNHLQDYSRCRHIISCVVHLDQLCNHQDSITTDFTAQSSVGL